MLLVAGACSGAPPPTGSGPAAVTGPTAAEATPVTTPAVTAVPASATTPAASASQPGTAFHSDRYGYGLVVPAGWSVSEPPGNGGLHPDEPGVDTFRGPNGRILSITSEPVAAGTTLDAWTCAIGRHLETDHETPVDSTEPLLAAGRNARLSRYHLHIDPYVIHYLDVELLHGGRGLTLSMESTAHDDAADEVVLRGIVDSLTVDG